MIFEEYIIQWGKTTSENGILTVPSEPKQDFCVVFINAGIIHKVGPNRMSVKYSRFLAGDGIFCFRFDLAGIGDNNTVEGAISDPVFQLRCAMDAVSQKARISRFVLVGICSGAEISLRACILDLRVIGLSLIEGDYLGNSDSRNIFPVVKRRNTIRYYRKYLFSLSRWRKMLSGKSSVLKLLTPQNLELALSSVFVRSKTEPRLSQVHHSVQFQNTFLNELISRGVRIDLVFAEGGMAIDIFNITIERHLREYIKRDKISYKYIKDVDHTFTPIWSQEFLLHHLHNWMKSM